MKCLTENCRQKTIKEVYNPKPLIKNIISQRYRWLENVRGHFTENTRLEPSSPISLHYKNGPLFQNEGTILKSKGQFRPRPLPKLSLISDIISVFCQTVSVQKLNKCSYIVFALKKRCKNGLRALIQLLHQVFQLSILNKSKFSLISLIK